MEAAALDTSQSQIPVPHPRIYGSQRPGGSLDSSLPGPAVFESMDLESGKDTDAILEEIGVSAAEKRQLVVDGALGEQHGLSAIAISKL